MTASEFFVDYLEWWIIAVFMLITCAMGCCVCCLLVRRYKRRRKAHGGTGYSGHQTTSVEMEKPLDSGSHPAENTVPVKPPTMSSVGLSSLSEDSMFGGDVTDGKSYPGHIGMEGPRESLYVHGGQEGAQSGNETASEPAVSHNTPGRAGVTKMDPECGAIAE